MAEGDAELSSHILKLWQLQQHVLLKWGTYCIFTWDMYSVPQRKKGYLRFFVPEDSTYRYEIVKFLEHELESENREPFEDPRLDYRFPGVEMSVRVIPFSGLQWYLEREHVEAIAKEMMQRLMKAVKEKKKNDGNPDKEA